jgi:hypothetical protein
MDDRVDVNHPRLRLDLADRLRTGDVHARQRFKFVFAALGERVHPFEVAGAAAKKVISLTGVKKKGGSRAAVTNSAAARQ